MDMAQVLTDKKLLFRYCNLHFGLILSKYQLVSIIAAFLLTRPSNPKAWLKDRPVIQGIRSRFWPTDRMYFLKDDRHRAGRDPADADSSYTGPMYLFSGE